MRARSWLLITAGVAVLGGCAWLTVRGVREFRRDAP